MSENRLNNPVPFFVVDRQKSLEILKFSKIHKQPFPLGLMGNANSSDNFHEEFQKFPGKNIIKMADSGIFTKQGGLTTDYGELFEKYEKMGTDYGIILDVIKNKKKTLESAKKAMKEYVKKRHSFRLVGVAQGKTVKEYLSCYKSLKKIGYQHIAIGGLLTKYVDTARFVVVRDESFVEKVVSTIRNEFPNDWLFLLGCFRPRRFHLLKKYNIFGADFKGWIFNYKNPAEKKLRLLRNLDNIETHLKIRNQYLHKLKKKYAKSIVKSKDGKFIRVAGSEKEREVLDEIIKIRKKIKLVRSNKEYKEKLSQLIDLSKSDSKTLQKTRFEQVKKFLNKQVFSPMHPKKLMIISCSERKKNFLNLTPAMDLYDGPMYRMIRNFEPIYYNGIDVMIISAKYGLISHNHPIRNYDLRLTKNRIPKLREIVKNRLVERLRTTNYNEIMFSMGKDYLRVFDGIKDIVPADCKIRVVNGKIGEKLQETKNWLVTNT